MTGARSIRIGLLWHTFGHDNLGVDALSRGNEALISEAARRIGREVRFVALGSVQRPIVEDLPNNVEVGASPSLKQFLKGKFGFLRDLKRCDIVFDIGEGDSFTDLYGVKRLLYQISTKLLAKRSGCKVVLSPQTIGPFDNPLLRAVSAWTMERVDAVYTRDTLSTAFLRELGVRAASDEFIDVAFALPFVRREKVSGKTQVGINVSGLLYNQGYSGRNELGIKLNYRNLIDRFITHLTAQDSVDVHLFSHVAGGGGNDDDFPANSDVALRFPNCSVIASFGSSVQAKSWMSGLDFVMAGRMHACIGAFSAGVPVVPIAYSRKFNGLFETLKYPYYIDGKTVSTDDAVYRLIDLFNERSKLSSALDDGRMIIHRRLDAYQSKLGEHLATL